ncbi:MAG: penicillin-binding transpeptidase domain-containing protein [bacterium]|nr:penicillin-binding transpeptidase domain-containing protein [bacterium]
MFFKKGKNYWVSLENEDRVTPEETLLDSNSQYSDIEKPIPSYIFQFFLIWFCSLTLFLTIFLFKTGILEHEVFAQLASQNKSANLPLSPPRGMILDQNGQPLVQNVPIFNLLAVSRELKDDPDGLDKKIEQIADLLSQDEKLLASSIREQMKTNNVFFAHLDLTKEQALAVEYFQFPGFYVVPDHKREYLDGLKMSQVVGYTGKVSKDDLKNDEYYFPTDVVGRLGIEYQYEELLRGEHGNISFSREKSGYVAKNPESGKTVVLNIDHDLQIKLYDEIFTVLRDSGLSRASGVVQDPNNGAVLALVSFPSFDNNIFSSGVSESDYERLFENPAKPLFNRVISGLYNPGSTIKPFIGMTALQEKIISPDYTINDCVNLTVPNPYDQQNPYIFRNWRTEYGPFDLKKSIANSCNIYFFTLGGGRDSFVGLGADRIARYLKSALADSELGIDIPGEKNGFIPTPDWKLLEKGEPWYLGDTYNISIGQGDLLVTPLWLNAYVSAIANMGTVYKPLVAREIWDKNDIVKKIEPEILISYPFSENVINEVRNAMKETVLSGTAQIFKELSVQAGAKTGTAEVIKGVTANSLFTVFAPYDNPKIVMTILIEGATTQQGLAIRAAYNTLKWHFDR